MKAPPPPRDGVNPSSVWLPDGSWKTILDFLADRFPEISTAMWTARMERGAVIDSSGMPLGQNAPYCANIKIYYYREIEIEAPIPFEETVLYQDEHLLVVDKPHFLPVIPSGRYLQETLLVRLRRKLQCDFLAPIHRIDRETAGLVLFSMRPETRGAYQSLFQQRTVVKTYEAIAPTRPDLAFPLIYRSRLVEGQPFFRTQEVDGEPNSETHIEILASRPGVALYRLKPITGRKHQLRVHMMSLGIPIFNDSLYPKPLPIDKTDYSHPLQLVARGIAFTDPVTGIERKFESQYQLAAGTSFNR